VVAWMIWMSRSCTNSRTGCLPAGRATGIPGAAQQGGPRTPVGDAVQDQAENPARVGSCERDGATASVGNPEHHRSLGSGSIHHRGQIHHALLHARQRTGRVGQPRAPLIKADHPARMLQRGHEPAVAQLLPLQVQVRYQPRHNTRSHWHDPSPQEVPARTHADPVAKKRLPRQIDRPRCRPGGRLMRQITPFGRETGSHVSYQVADHIGGSGAAVTTHAVTFRDRSGCLRAVPDVR
jgi:hypothetical protein